MDEFTVYKILCELKFHPQILFYDALHKIADVLFKNYIHWTHDGKKVLLSDYKKRSVLGIEHNRLVLEQDIPESIADFKSKFDKAFMEYNEKVAIKEFDRIGLRSQYFMPMKFSFPELVKLTREKFLPQSKSLSDIVGSITQDYQYNIVSKNSDFNIHMFCGPVKKSEIPRLFIPAAVAHKEDETLKKIDFPDVAFFADLDCYIDSPSKSDLNKFLEKFIEFIPIFIEKMERYIKE